MKHLANFLQNEMARLEKLKEFDISSWKAPDLKEVESFFDRILKTLLTSLFFFLGTAGRWKFFECLLLTSLNKIWLTIDFRDIFYYLLLLLFIIIYYYLFIIILFIYYYIIYLLFIIIF